MKRFSKIHPEPQKWAFKKPLKSHAFARGLKKSVVRSHKMCHKKCKEKIHLDLIKMQIFSSEKSQQVRYCFSDGPEPIDLPFKWLIADFRPLTPEELDNIVVYCR